jgi:hypothetical protein
MAPENTAHHFGDFGGFWLESFGVEKHFFRRKDKHVLIQAGEGRSEGILIAVYSTWVDEGEIEATVFRDRKSPCI